MVDLAAGILVPVPVPVLVPVLVLVLVPVLVLVLVSRPVPVLAGTHPLSRIAFRRGNRQTRAHPPVPAARRTGHPGLPCLPWLLPGVYPP